MRRILAFAGALAALVLLVVLYPQVGETQSRTPAPIPNLNEPGSPDADDAPAALALFALTQEWQRCPNSFCETGWYASPAVADLDDNGALEVYWGGYTLMAVDGDSGSLFASVPGDGARLWPSIVATDLEGDGAQEIVIANGVGEVHVYNENLVRRLGWPKKPFGDDNEIRSLAVADLDNDGVKEIIVCSTRSDNQWAVLENNGTFARAGRRCSTAKRTVGRRAASTRMLPLATLMAMGGRRLLAPTIRTMWRPLRAMAALCTPTRSLARRAGSNKPWARVGLHVDNAVDLRGYANCGTEHRPNMANSAPVIADVNSDEVLEVLFVGNVYNCGEDPYESLYEAPFILKGDRTRWKASGLDWTVIPTPASDAAPLSEDFERIEMNVPNPALADLDSDGFPEILHPSYDGKLHAWSLGKAEHGDWPYDLQPAGGAYLRFGSEPVIADLNDDGMAEVILTTWTENGSNAPGQLLILSFDGNLLQAIDLPWDAADGRGGALGAPTLANLDDDDNLEVVVGTINRGLVAYEIADSADRACCGRRVEPVLIAAAWRRTPGRRRALRLRRRLTRRLPRRMMRWSMRLRLPTVAAWRRVLR